MKRIALALIVVIAGTIYGLRLLSPKRQPIDLKLSVMVGMELGDIYVPYNCYYQYQIYSNNPDLPCYSRDFTISFSVGPDRTITRVSYMDSRPVGDFFQLWGTPIGMEDFHLLKYVYWRGGKFISVIDDHFYPAGKVTLFGFVRDLPKDMKDWKGFKQTRR